MSSLVEREGRERETPSLSLRLRSVQAVLGLANAARTKSNSIRVHSNCVRFSFEKDMSNLNTLNYSTLAAGGPDRLAVDALTHNT
jgi:hypothetical protein